MVVARGAPLPTSAARMVWVALRAHPALVWMAAEAAEYLDAAMMVAGWQEA